MQCLVEGWSSCLSARVHFNLDLLDWLSMERGWIDVGRWQMFGVYEGVQFSCYHFGGRIRVRRIMAPISSFWLQEKMLLSYSALTCLSRYISSLSWTIHPRLPLNPLYSQLINTSQTRPHTHPHQFTSLITHLNPSSDCAVLHFIQFTHQIP